MFKFDHDLDASFEASDPTSPQEVLAAENVSLRLLLTQAKLSAETLLAQAGIDAKEREASDKLQKLILEELHHRIKNTLATVGAIAAQSLRNAPSMQHAQHAIEGRLLALGRALMSDPKMLLLDEPSLGLAPAIVDTLYDTLWALHDEGLTLLLAEQSVPLALEIADYAYVLQTGRTVLEGAARQLEDDPQVQKIYLGIKDGSD